MAMTANARNALFGNRPRVLPRRDWLFLLGGLGAVALVCWMYLLKTAADMGLN